MWGRQWRHKMQKKVLIQYQWDKSNGSQHVHQTGIVQNLSCSCWLAPAVLRSPIAWSLRSQGSPREGSLIRDHCHPKFAKLPGIDVTKEPMPIHRKPQSMSRSLEHTILILWLWQHPNEIKRRNMPISSEGQWKSRRERSSFNWKHELCRLWIALWIL